MSETIISKHKFKKIDSLTEFKDNIPIYDPEPFLITEKEAWNRIYRFPFDTLDSSPAAKGYSGCSYGRIEWNIEPRKLEWSRSEKRFYIKQILVWARQTRDKTYSDIIFGIDCNVAELNGTVSPLYDYQSGMLNNMWKMTPSAVTKTPMFACYPPNGFNLLEIDLTSSMFCEPKFLNFEKIPNTELHYEQTKRLVEIPREYCK